MSIALLNPVLRLAAVVLLFTVVPVASGAQPLKALMVTGGCCHDYAKQKLILSQGIGARANVVFDIVHEGGDTREHMVSIYQQADWAKGYDVVLHNECFGMVSNVAFVERIAAVHKAGVPAVMLHCSSHSYRAAATEEWRQCVGITSVKHEKRRDLTVERVNATHPVMQGFPETWLNKSDELYINLKVWPNVVPLAKAHGVETKQDHVVIWVNTYGKGRVFSTTLGHLNETMENPLYLDLVTRGLLWACDKLDESGKPRPGYGPASSAAK